MKKLLLAFSFTFIFLTFQAQQTDSLQTTNTYKPTFSSKQLILPGSLMLAGIAINGNNENSIKNQVKDWRNDHMKNFRNHTDDVLQFAPYAAVYGFEWLGMKPENDFKNRTAIMIKSHIINLGLVYILKKSVANPRPDGTRLSFPSGHTAEAFAGATMVSIEYGKRYQWVPYAAFGTATIVGALRVANNKHYLSDVLFGAGLGILSAKIAYWTHQYKWNKPQKSIDSDPYNGIIYNK